MSALYLLITSVIILANLGQVLRSADETVRWKLKILILWVGALFAAVVYLRRLRNSLGTFSSSVVANKKVQDLNQIVRSLADKIDAGVSEHLRLELADLAAGVGRAFC